jgi:hypothetical protein
VRMILDKVAEGLPWGVALSDGTAVLAPVVVIVPAAVGVLLSVGGGPGVVFPPVGVMAIGPVDVVGPDSDVVDVVGVVGVAGGVEGGVGADGGGVDGGVVASGVVVDIVGVVGVEGGGVASGVVVGVVVSWVSLKVVWAPTEEVLMVVLHPELS